MNHHHALVVGGTRGLGKSLVEFWQNHVAAISVIGRRIPVASDPAESRVKYFSADLADADAVLPRLDEIMLASGKVSKLVFAQRFRGEGDSFDGELAIGLTATRRIIDQLVKKHYFAERAAIVIVSSVASHLIASEQQLGYHVVKAALEQLVRYYAIQLASHGIRVNAVAPNLIEKDENRDFYRSHPELKRHFESMIPLGKMGSSIDVANAIDFLCDERSGHITGQTLIVDGGLTLLLQHGMRPKPEVTKTENGNPSIAGQ